MTQNWPGDNNDTNDSNVLNDTNDSNVLNDTNDSNVLNDTKCYGAAESRAVQDAGGLLDAAAAVALVDEIQGAVTAAGNVHAAAAGIGIVSAGADRPGHARVRDVARIIHISR